VILADGGGGGGQVVNLNDLQDVAGLLPTAAGGRAERHAKALPVGDGAFGHSPAGYQLQEVWALNAAYLQEVTGKLKTDLLGLRGALLAAVDRTADAEAEAAARFAALATDSATTLDTAPEAFALANESETAQELAAQALGADANPDTRVETHSGAEPGDQGDAAPADPVPTAPATTEPGTAAGDAPAGVRTFD
jgi:hypothetical protein